MYWRWAVHEFGSPGFWNHSPRFPSASGQCQLQLPLPIVVVCFQFGTVVFQTLAVAQCSGVEYLGVKNTQFWQFLPYFVNTALCLCFCCFMVLHAVPCQSHPCLRHNYFAHSIFWLVSPTLLRDIDLNSLF